MCYYFIMKIEEWLKNFKRYWESKELDMMMSLFTDDVVYFETPFVQVKSKEELLKEWQGVLLQDDISVEYEIFSEVDGKSAVLWGLSYKKDEVRHDLKGTYFIELNREGRCTYFLQTCESK